MVVALAGASALAYQGGRPGGAGGAPARSGETARQINVAERVFDGYAFAFLGAFAGVAFILALIVGVAEGEGAGALLRALESMILCFLGGFMARTLVALLLAAARDDPDAGLAVGWGFLIWPGLIDTFPKLASLISGSTFKPVVTAPDALMWLAVAVGAFCGMMDGLWKVHDWKGLGWLSFPLDITWGLAGNTNAALLHIINFAWAGHGDETRKGAHRYKSGFRIKGTFAFTQGAVMSNLKRQPGDGLYNHERTHSWQNRIFGPLFVLTYMAWMAVWVIPGMIAGLIVGAGPFQGAEKWCYFNNPWEAWGYAVQGESRASVGGNSDEERRLIWPAIFVILWAIPFFGLSTVAFVFVVNGVWG